MRLRELYSIVTRALNSSPGACDRPWKQTIPHVLRDPEVRRCIGWQSPAVEDLTDLVDARDGRVRVVRLDSLGDGAGHKIPVVAGLIVRYVLFTLERRRPIRGFIDGGNVCTGLALGYYAKHFDLEARLVMSSLFPQDIIDYIEAASEGRLQAVLAPRTSHGREREFYEHLARVVRDRANYGDFACLWHAKYGGRVLRPMGQLVASALVDMPDVIVLSLGAGAVLEGWALPIQERFGMKPQIVVVEHATCPLVELAPMDTSGVKRSLPQAYSTEWLREPPPRTIPHAVLGPHYDEINPCIDRRVLGRIHGVVRYTDSEWKQMASHCREKGLSIGNSSAVNLLVSRWLAESGKSVLTFVYEPCRDYYKASREQQVEHAISRSEAVS